MAVDVGPNISLFLCHLYRCTWNFDMYVWWYVFVFEALE